MSWKEKHQHTSLEQTDFPIHGLFFLDGDVIARVIHGAGTEGLKYPMISFPSGEEFPLWDIGSAEQAVVHLFGEMDLPLRTTRDEGGLRAQDIANMLGYAIRLRGEDKLDVWSEDEDERFTITYNNSLPTMVNIERLTEQVEAPIHPAHILMNDELRAKLPPLFSSEKLGLDAVAPVKYFLPGLQWTWYAAEFDGDDLFFGLVAGYEVELGTFSLAELQSLHGGLMLRVERDLHYEPKTIRELQELHR